ncbi:MULTISPECIES: hypothetical protein [Roseobacteraceae]|uniref:hypothetical protein n=1 Tax=Roseobacteraceae TaxID=2854170 RepID=UPI003298DC60
MFVGDGLTAAEVAALNTAIGLLITGLAAVDTTPVEVTDLTFTSGDPVAGAFNILEDATVHFVIDTVETGATVQQVADGDNTLDVAADYAWSATVAAPNGAITGTFPSGLNGSYYLKAAAELSDGTLSNNVAVAGPVTINTLVTPPSYDEDFQTDPYVGTYESEALFPTLVDGTTIILTQDTATDGSSTLPGSSLGRLSFAGSSSGYSRIEIPVDGATAFAQLVVRWGNTSGSSSLSRDGRMFWMDASKAVIGSTFNNVNLGAQQFSKALYNGDQAPSLGSMPATARYLAIEVNVSPITTSFVHDLEFKF